MQIEYLKGLSFKKIMEEHIEWGLDKTEILSSKEAKANDSANSDKKSQK